MESRMTAVETTVESLKKDVEQLCDKQDNHEGRITDLEKSHVVMESNSQMVRDTVTEQKTLIKEGYDKLENLIMAFSSETKEDIKELRQKREEDHYVKPLSKHEARAEQMYKWIVGGILGALVGALMTALLSSAITF